MCCSILTASIGSSERLLAAGPIYRGLEALYQTETGIDPEAMVIRRAVAEGAREQLLLRETDDDLEVALVFDEQLLSRFESKATDRAFADEHLGDALRWSRA